MAFNFNWSPLIADTERVKDMLTSALNKSPKPPIIVDDIIVKELNLGTTPPELEILEIGDLAEDKFRGIFKMSYTGDAYLTLTTRVQANPLNTYLSTKPAFASPQPLAANSSLTIPVQITLSDIRLSGFVILVFSKQKGITIVFRNDPLETLKVSSTFDSIPFVRNYLQKTIENQLRVLFVEDLPAIIHRLSLRLFSPEHQMPDLVNLSSTTPDGQQLEIAASDVQLSEDSIDDWQQTSPGESPTEIYASFSQKNLLRLAALTESQRTLNPFTPGIRDSVYRAWTGPAHSEHHRHGNVRGSSTPTLQTALSHIQGSRIAPSNLSSAASQISDTASQATRPTLRSTASHSTLYSLSTGQPRTRPKKRKHRIVDLRKKSEPSDVNDNASVASSYDDSASRSVTGSTESSNLMEGTHPSSAPSVYLHDDELTTPPSSPPRPKNTTSRLSAPSSRSVSNPITPNATIRASRRPQALDDNDLTPRPPPVPTTTATTISHSQSHSILPTSTTHPHQPPRLPRMATFSARTPSPELRRDSSVSAQTSSSYDLHRSASERKLHTLLSSFNESAGGSGSGGGGILEQAWMQKMAAEIARKVAEEKSVRARGEEGEMGGRGGRHWSVVSEGGEAPPAYGS